MTDTASNPRADGDANDLVCLSLALRAVRKESRTVEFVASTDCVDSYGEIVEQKWDLARYESNPVVLYNHSRFGTTLPIGTATCAMEDGKLCTAVTFVTADANPLAEQVWQSVQQKSLRAVSVGFVPRSSRYEMRDGKSVCVLSDNELHEISVVPIPANPEALARARALARNAPGPATRAATLTPTESPMSTPQAAVLDVGRIELFLPLAAQLGVAAASDDDARAKIQALAAEAIEVRAAVALPPGATRSAVTAKIAELSAAAATLPKLQAEADALRAEKEAREVTERTAHVDALVAATPALTTARAALEAFAKADYAAFCKSYPRVAASPRERALTSRMAPSGGTPERSFEAHDDAPQSHGEQADAIAQKLMADQPTKYAADDDGYFRALADASRQLKAAATRVRS